MVSGTKPAHQIRRLPAMSTPLRVLIVTVVHDPEDARIRHRQIQALLQAGHRVAYAAPFSAFDRKPPQGVCGFDLPRARGRRRLAAVRAARRLIGRVGPAVDVVLVHDPDLLLALAGMRRRTGAVIWDVHEDTAAALSMRPWVPKPFRGLLAAGLRTAERWAERRYHLLLAESGYQRRFRRPHPVVPNTVRVPPDRPPAPGSRRVVYLGKLTLQRGGFDLIELAKLVPEVQVEIIGPAEPDVAAELEEASRSGLVNWTGFVSNDQALQMLPGALAGVSLLHDEPNYRHSPPTKIMEYMAHGVPVITTPNPASAGLVTNGGCGAVVGFGDIAGVAAVLRSWITDDDERRRLGAAGYAYARAHLDWNRDEQEFVAALEGIVRGR